MLVGVDVKCMHTNFDGHGVIGFRDIATFKNDQISLSDQIIMMRLMSYLVTLVSLLSVIV